MAHTHTHTHDHDHHHDHDHDHAHSHGIGHHHAPNDKRSLVIAMVLTGLIFVAQVIGGYISNSLALLSDAGHMLTDLAALGISLFALRMSENFDYSANRRYTFGMKRIEILAALLNGVLLLGICGYIIYEAVERFLEPQEVLAVPMLAVASLGLLANLASAYFLYRSESMNVRSAYLHVLTDALSSVAVIVGGIIMYFTKISWIDPLFSLLISLFIIRGAYRVVLEAGRILLESAPADAPPAEVVTEVKKINGVEDVHDIHVWEISPGETAMSAHVVVASVINRDLALREVRTMLLEKFSIRHSTIQIESEEYSRDEDCGDCHMQQ